jgi:hypothetical protein
MRTNKRGERVYIYAGLQRIEREEEARIATEFGIDVDALPRGVIVGTVEIVGCKPLRQEHSPAACFYVTKSTKGYAWLLSKPERIRATRKPTRHPQPSFFTPF